MTDRPNSGPLHPATYVHVDNAVEHLANVKKVEEWLLKGFDIMSTDPEVDKRWLAIGRTAIEQGFMAIDRAVSKPPQLEAVE